MEDKVKVVNLVSSRVNINIPELTLRRVWERKGSVKTIPFSQLEEAMYNPGVEALFTQGVLGIEDMDVKKELGLEPEDAEEPVNIIVLTDKQRRQYWVNFPLDEFKKKVDELPKEQVELLADYAIDNRIIDIDKCDFMQQKCGRNIIRAIELNKADAEGR